MADFFTRIGELEQMVGSGSLQGIFGVDGGARTVPLEVGGWKTGPNAGVQMHNFTSPGTGPHAAQNSFEATWEASLEDIAKTTLESGPQEAMERHVERVNESFKKLAPRVTGEYAESTGRFVVDGGQPRYERRGTHYGHDPGEGPS